ncbi:MAG: methyl-accepting chemotaxis protein [Deltaproteobacteria bacterium]|nr:methyl-accepting chemotaxis protein [Deltaproteobacteria bacterium]
MSVRWKLMSKVLGLFAVLLLTILGSTLVLSSQEADGLQINLAGRQRMLSQRMTKEALLLERSLGTARQDRAARDLKATTALFHTTLHALTEGGEAVGGDGQAVRLPPAKGEATLSALERGMARWDAVSPLVDQALATGQPEAIRAAVGALEENNLALLKDMNEATGAFQASSDRHRSALTWVQLLAVLLSVATLYAIYRSLEREVIEPLLRAVAFAEGVTLGRLDQRLDAQGEDELARLAGALTAMSHQLGRSFRELNEVSQRLSSYTRQLDGTALQLDASASLAASHTGAIATEAAQMSGAIEDLGAKLRQADTELSEATAQAGNVSRSIASVGAVVQSISEDTQGAALSFREMVNGLEDYRHDTHEITEATASAVGTAITHIEGLADAMQVVGNVLFLIKDLAEQIQFLSLNASIEAAAAGEAGKGFAVVAHEIKGLSLQTHNATKNIEVKLSGMEENLERATAVIRALDGQVDTLKDTIGHLSAAMSAQGRTVSEANARLAQTASSVYQINLSVAEVTTAAAQIGHGLEQATQHLQRVSSGSAQVSLTMGGLLESTAQIHRATTTSQRQVKVITGLSSTLSVTADSLRSSVAGIKAT